MDKWVMSRVNIMDKWVMSRVGSMDKWPFPLHYGIFGKTKGGILRKLSESPEALYMTSEGWGRVSGF